MKQYTTSEQTAKLIELGFAQPKNERWVLDVANESTPSIQNIVKRQDYSIGELIEFIPDTGNRNLKDRRIFGAAVLYYGREMIYQFDEEPELIDNLFDMIVKLKEYGEI